MRDFRRKTSREQKHGCGPHTAQALGQTEPQEAGTRCPISVNLVVCYVVEDSLQQLDNAFWGL